MQTARTKQIINDLILITQARISDYENGIELLKKEHNTASTENNPMINLFEKIIHENKSFINALGKELSSIGHDIPSTPGTNASIYFAWLDLKEIFFLHHGNGATSYCEAGDNAAQKVYKNVLQDTGLPAFIRSMIIAHKATIKSFNNEFIQLKEQCCAG